MNSRKLSCVTIRAVKLITPNAITRASALFSWALVVLLIIYPFGLSYIDENFIIRSDSILQRYNPSLRRHQDYLSPSKTKIPDKEHLRRLYTRMVYLVVSLLHSSILLSDCPLMRTFTPKARLPLG